MNKVCKKVVCEYKKKLNLHLCARYSHFSLKRGWNLYQIGAKGLTPTQVIQESEKIY